MFSLFQNFSQLVERRISERISQNFDALLGDAQDEELFKFDALKSRKTEQKLALLGGARKIVVGQLFQRFRSENYEVGYLPPRFWLFDSVSEDHFRAMVSGSVVVLQNNDFSQISYERLLNFARVVDSVQDAVFVIWDTDNHHWLFLSTLLALIFDFYVPSHLENLSIVSRFNSNILGPHFTGSLQWERQFLLDRLDILLNTPRQESPFGMHGLYEKFSMRNKIVQTLSLRYPGIGFTSGAYKSKTDQDNFDEWSSFKLHFAALVNNDVPYRIFDAVITGGVALLPQSLGIWRQEIGFSEQVVFYSNMDVMEPGDLMARAAAKYESFRSGLSPEKMAAIVGDAHVDGRIEKLAAMALKGSVR